MYYASKIECCNSLTLPAEYGPINITIGGDSKSPEFKIPCPKRGKLVTSSTGRTL